MRASYTAYCDLKNEFYFLHIVNIMLLELLQHHEGIFVAVIDHLVSARDCHTLGALSAANRRLNIVVSAVPWWQHCRKMHNCHKLVKSINILQNKFVTIRELNDVITTYSYYPYGDVFKDGEAYYVHNNTKKSYRYIYHTKYSRMGAYRCGRINISIKGSVPEWVYRYNYISIIGADYDRYVFEDRGRS
jgi:hypothetical protein